MATSSDAPPVSASTGSNAIAAVSAAIVVAPIAASSHIVGWNARRSRARSTSTMPAAAADVGAEPERVGHRRVRRELRGLRVRDLVDQLAGRPQRGARRQRQPRRALALTGEGAQREQGGCAEHERDVDPGREGVEQPRSTEAEGHGDVGGEDDHKARPHHPQDGSAWNLLIHQLLPTNTNLSPANCRDNRAWTVGRGHVAGTSSAAPVAPESCAAAKTSCAVSASAGVMQPRRSPSASSRSAR